MILDLVASIRLKLSVQRLLEMQFPKASFDTIVDLVLVRGLEVLLLNLYTSCVACCGWSQNKPSHSVHACSFTFLFILDHCSQPSESSSPPVLLS